MKAKKILSMLLAALLVVAMLPMGIIAAGAAETGLTGTGTQADPYKIWDAAGYAEFVIISKTTSTEGVFVELAADIDFVNRENIQKIMKDANEAWKAANNKSAGVFAEVTDGENVELNPLEFSIGSDGSRVAAYGATDPNYYGDNWFKGTFDGKGHTIKNFNISLGGGLMGGSWMNVEKPKPSEQKSLGYEPGAMFGKLGNGAVIKNFTLDGAYVNTANGDKNAFIAFRNSAAGDVLTFENITIKNSSTYSRADDTGLLIAYTYGATTNAKNITVENVTGNVVSDWGAYTLFGRLYGEVAGGQKVVTVVNAENITVSGCTFKGKNFAGVFVVRAVTAECQELNLKGTNVVQGVDYFATAATPKGVDFYCARDVANLTITGKETVTVKDYWADGYKTNVEVTEDAYLLKITPAVSGAIKAAAGGYGLVVNGGEALQAVDGVVTIALTADQLDEEFDVVLVYVGEDNQPVVVNDCALNDVTFNKALANADKATQDYIYSMDAYEAATAAYFAGEEVAENVADYEAVADIAVEGESANVAYQGTSLVLGETVAVRVYFTYLEGKDPTTLIATIDGMLVDVIDKGDGWYYVEIAGLKMKNLDATYAVVVDGITVTTSVYSYCKALAAAEDANAANLGAAVYNYAVASKAFLPADVVEEA